MPLATLENIYFATESNLDRDLFLPVAKQSYSICCMTGYFSSSVFSALSKSLAVFLSTEGSELKFIVSPNFSDDDLDAIEHAIEVDENLIPLLFPDFELNEKNLEQKALLALSYLVASKNLEIRVALKKRGMFHSKCWVCYTAEGPLSIHGSVNATASGISRNFEQIAVNKSWENTSSQRVVSRFENVFSKLWDDDYPEIKTVELNSRTISFLKQNASQIAGNGELVENFISELLEEEQDLGELHLSEPQKLVVPNWLNYSTGPFAHQGAAIEAWFENEGRGILSIATGGGKTLTALVSATLAQQHEDSILIVIGVPTVALLDQWADDVKKFGVIPLNTRHVSSALLGQEINKRLRNLRLKNSKVEVLLLTHDSLKSDRIKRLLTKASNQCSIMLIGDEVHNLGSVGYMESALDIYKYRLGLSATFERQFDETGTHFLLDHFGKVVFEYSLDQAIGQCLVPFKYHVCEVTLDEDEENEWTELTHQIRKLSYASELPDGDSSKERWKLLCLKRRRIVEGASGKVAALAATLPQKKEDIQRTLIFCTDKQPEQLESVNRLLTRRELNFHQVTAEETSNKAKLASIVESFDRGDFQVLTSKRVLDEGFNIPQTETAYLLASNTIERQWVQRLGRILRLSKSTGKTHAVVYDFVALPNSLAGKIDPDMKSLIRGEIKRVQFFSSLSRSDLDKQKSFQVVNNLIELLEAK